MKINSKLSDKLGIFLSFVCLVHCLAMPLVFIAFPILKNLDIWHDHTFHGVMFFLVLLPVLMTFAPHCYKTKDYSVLILPFIGLILLFLTSFIFHFHGTMNEVVINSIGSICLIFAHYKHLKTKTCQH